MYVNSDAMRIANGVEAMDQILAEPELKQPPVPKTTDRYDVKFENVSFSYEKDKEKQAISNVSFHARQGEVTAIVGPSGGGKVRLPISFHDSSMWIRVLFPLARWISGRWKADI